MTRIGLLLNGLLRVSLSPATAETPNHAFSPSATYAVPRPGPVKQYLDFIDGLPINPAPEAFGLHVNADIQKDQNDTTTLCRQVQKSHVVCVGEYCSYCALVFILPVQPYLA